jgi:hypothetical protein
VVQALSALQPLRFFDSSRALLRTFLDADTLRALMGHGNDVVRQLAHETAHDLALL